VDIQDLLLEHISTLAISHQKPALSTQHSEIMLKPFRIRNLYFNSSDLVDCSGVVQLSPQQYDHEIQSTPEAGFAYIDEDDGETVTVSLI
jgi:hypothetical protein